MDPTKHLYAQLQEVDDIRGKYKRAEKLKQFDSPQLAVILDLAYNPHIQFNMDPTVVKWEKSKDSEKSLVYRLKQECKKLVNLTNVGPYPNLPLSKKQLILKSTLETLHPEDAELLISVIQKKLPFEKMNKEVALEAFPEFAEKWKEAESAKEED